MQDFSGEIAALRKRLGDAETYLKIGELRERRPELEDASARPDLWDDPDEARKVTGELAAVVRAEALATDGRVFMTEVGTMDDHLGYVYFLPRMAAVIMSLVGLLALLLACMGLYGMVSYNVARRTRELGIRVALGADQQRLEGMVLRGGVVLIALGGIVGVAGSVGLGTALGRSSRRAGRSRSSR